MSRIHSKFVYNETMIRPYTEEDFETVTAFWFEAMNVAMPEMMKRMGYELQSAREYFRNVVVPENKIWIYELAGAPVAFLGMQGDLISRLYVDPRYQRQGIGQALLEYAKAGSPSHLWLYTHVANKMARAFYEKHGFMAKKFGVSAPPESEADVEYHWNKK